MKKNLFLLFISGTFGIFAQSPLEYGVLETTLEATGGTENRSSVAFNPKEKIYYSVNAGATRYPIEAYDIKGNRIASLTSAFDYRGAWWNPNTNQLEGNGFNNLGIWIHSTSSNGKPISAGKNDLPLTSGPDVQSNGDYDPIDDEILYYMDGSIFRHARKDNSLISSVEITGLPVDLKNINWNSIAYTGVNGMEAGIYDNVNKALYFINKITGEYVTKCQLPQSAPNEHAFKMGFANKQLFVFSGDTRTWYGYLVLEDCANSVSTLTENVCGEYTSGNGFTYTESGVYEEIIPNKMGCDSIITINLTILSDKIDLGVSQIDNMLISNHTNLLNEYNLSRRTSSFATYQWYSADLRQPIIGANSQTFIPTNSGSYFVEIKMNDCIVNSEEIRVKVAEITEHKNVYSYKIYPNPTQSIFYVEDMGNKEGIERIELLSLSGTTLDVVMIPNGRTPLNLASFSNGIYIVRIHTKSNVQSELVIKH